MFLAYLQRFLNSRLAIKGFGESSNIFHTEIVGILSRGRNYFLEPKCVFGERTGSSFWEVYIVGF